MIFTPHSDSYMQFDDEVDNEKERPLRLNIGAKSNDSPSETDLKSLDDRSLSLVPQGSIGLTASSL